MMGFDIPIWAYLGAAAISAGAGAYNTAQTNSANSAIAAASNSHDLGTFREANDFNRAQGELTRQFNAQEAGLARDFTAAQTSAQQAYNSQEAQKNRDFQANMSNTQYQRAVGDMRAAGLNPMLAYSQGGAGNVGGSTASSAAPSVGAASAGSVGSAGAPRAHDPNYTGSAAAAGITSAVGGAQKMLELDNLQKQGELLTAQKNKVDSEVPINRQQDQRMQTENRWLNQEIEERLNAAKLNNSMRNITNRMSIELEETRKAIVREHLSQEQISTRLMAIQEKMDQAGIPKAEAEGKFYSQTGPSMYYADMAARAMGAVSSAVGVARQAGGGSSVRMNRSFNQTNYDAHGNISGGYSRNYPGDN